MVEATPEGAVQPEPPVTPQPPQLNLVPPVAPPAEPVAPAEPLTMEQQLAVLTQKVSDQDNTHRDEMHKRDLEIARMQGRLEGGGGAQQQPNPMPFTTPEQWQAHARPLRLAYEMAQHGQFDETGESLKQQLGAHLQAAGGAFEAWQPAHAERERKRQLQEYRTEDYIANSGIEGSEEADALRSTVRGDSVRTEFLTKLLEDRRASAGQTGVAAAQQHTSGYQSAGVHVAPPVAGVRPIPTEIPSSANLTEEQKRKSLDLAAANALLGGVDSEARIESFDEKQLFPGI